MRSLLAVLCTFFSVQSFAASIDSIGVENGNGNQIVLHKVAAKETYYSIARLYKIAPKDIINFNNNVSLNIGTVIKVPTIRAFGTQAPAKENVKNSAANVTEEVIDYKVGPKESLFAIARKFGTTVNDIKQLNNLSSNNLSIGQVLKIKQGNAATSSGPSAVQAPAVTVIEKEKPAAHVTDSPPVTMATESETSPETAPKTTEKIKTRLGRLGVTEKNEKGIAIWLQDETLDSTKMLALHRTAPIGTIIKITNPMTERTTFVKVVGTFTENETSKDAIIVLTKATADLLGALDKRFLVNIDYGIPNE